MARLRIKRPTDRRWWWRFYDPVTKIGTLRIGPFLWTWGGQPMVQAKVVPIQDAQRRLELLPEATWKGLTARRRSSRVSRPASRRRSTRAIAR